MQYTYKYPNRLQSISGRRYGRISVAEDHLAQTHEELMSRLGAPDKTIAVQVEVNATKERVWDIAAGSISKFFSHHPVFAGLTQLNSLGSDEGGRFIVHRAINGCIFDRIGEILVNMPLSQYTMLGVAHPWALGVLAYQANSIKYHAEQGESEQ